MSEQSLKIPFNGNEFFINIAEGNMVSLNAVYEMADSPDNKDPSQWLRLSSTENSINSMVNDNMGKSHIIKSKRGKGGWTLAHWQLALSYAQYLSPKLHFAVNTVFKERLEEIIDPELGIKRIRDNSRKKWREHGKSEKWIASREQGIDVHGNYVNTLIGHNVNKGAEIGRCTNQIYRGLFNRDKGGMVESIRNRNPKLPKSLNVRDHVKLSSILAISLSEELSRERIEEVNADGVNECSNISLEKASSVRLALDDSRSKDKASLPPMEKKVVRDPVIYRKHFKEMRDALK